MTHLQRPCAYCGCLLTAHLLPSGRCELCDCPGWTEKETTA